ncbi:MAG TPA: septum formation family protein [Nocardioidaceae bacterium]|nr:septum formation family protein [Nocardioidaceae bacterium]
MVRVRSLAVGLALVALAGCAKSGDLVADEPAEPSQSPTTTQTTGAPILAPEPQVGTCRQLTVADIAPPTNDTSPVPCAKAHTAVTYYVDQWPKRMVQAASSIDDKTLQDYVMAKCDSAWRDTVGGSLEDWVISIVSWAWYRPTPEQFAEGARWFRCDVVAGQNTERLEDLPRSVNGLFDNNDYPDTFHACWTKVFSDQQGVDEGTLTSCARKHQQRAIGIVQLGNGKNDQQYPGADATFNQANELCADAVAKWRKEKEPGQFGLQWPRRNEWNGGERYATCWAVTRD